MFVCVTPAFLEPTCNQATKMTATILVGIKEYSNPVPTFICLTMHILSFLAAVIKVVNDRVRKF